MENKCNDKQGIKAIGFVKPITVFRGEMQIAHYVLRRLQQNGYKATIQRVYEQYNIDTYENATLLVKLVKQYAKEWQPNKKIPKHHNKSKKSKRKK